MDARADTREKIFVVQHDLRTAVETAKYLLRTHHAPFFQRGNRLVRPVLGKIKIIDGPQVREYETTISKEASPITLIPYLEALAKWSACKKDGSIGRVGVPQSVCRLVIDEQGEGFPPLTGFANAPYLTPSGRLIIEAGYDEETGIYLPKHNMEDLKIPEEPTKQDLAESVLLLLKLLDEFAFVSDVDKSVAMSILITPVIRPMMPVAPLHGTKAPHYANGKTYLLELAAAIAIGSDLPVVAFREKDSEELEKTLTGIALSGMPIACIDNVTVALKSALVAQMIERPRLTLRKLGGTDPFEVTNQMTVLASGKNLQINADLVRRSLVCNMNLNELLPWNHRFESNPLGMIRAHRSSYLAACLTIARFGFQSELHAACSPFASFSTWNKVVRSPLLYAGLVDPLGCVTAIVENDEQGETLGSIISIWHESLESLCGASTTAARLAEAATLARNQGNRALYEALMEVGGAAGELSVKRLGKWLIENANTPTPYGKIVQSGRTQNGVKRWKIEAISPASGKDCEG